MDIFEKDPNYTQIVEIYFTTLHVALNTPETRWSMSNFPCFYFKYLENFDQD